VCTNFNYLPSYWKGKDRRWTLPKKLHRTESWTELCDEGIIPWQHRKQRSHNTCLSLVTNMTELPFSRYVSPYFFRRFDPFSHFLLQGSLVHLHPGLVNILLTSKVQTGVTNLWAVAHTWPVFFPPPTSPLRLGGSGGYLSPTSPLHHNLHRHPYAQWS